MGRQDIHFSKKEFSTYTNDSSLNTEDFFDDYSFFKYLGFSKIDSIEKFDPDNNSIQLDLNDKIPESLFGKYDVVLDSGTLEHIFNIPNAFSNMVKMCKIGGRIININPVQGYTNHGFYNIQPTFFYSFFNKNGFSDCECYLMEFKHEDYSYNFSRKAACIEISNVNNLPFSSNHNVLIIFSARKIREAEIVYPDQYYYEYEYGKNTENESKNLRTTIKNLMPKTVQNIGTGLVKDYRKYMQQKKLRRKTFYI